MSDRADPESSTGRSKGASFILTIGAWALVAGMTSLWIRSTFLEPEGFANVATQVIGNDASGIQGQLTSEVLDVAFPDDSRQNDQRRAQAEQAMNDLLASGEVDDILRDELVALHAAVFDPQGDDPSLDLSGLVEPVQQRLDAEGIAVTIPTEGLSSVEFAAAGILAPVREAAGIARTVTLVLPIFGVLAIIGGLLLSDRRLRSLRWLGWNVAVSAGTIALFSLVSRWLVSAALGSVGVVPTGINAAWQALSNGLVIRMIGLAIVAIVVTVAASVALKRSQSAQTA